MQVPVGREAKIGNVSKVGKDIQHVKYFWKSRQLGVGILSPTYLYAIRSHDLLVRKQSRDKYYYDYYYTIMTDSSAVTVSCIKIS